MYTTPQTQLKDAQQEANDTRASQDELSSRLKETEKKWRNLDVELQQAQEVILELHFLYDNIFVNVSCFPRLWHRLNELDVLQNKREMIYKMKHLPLDLKCE